MIHNLIRQMEPELKDIRALMLEAVESVLAHDGMKQIIRDVAAAPGKMLRTVLMLTVAGVRLEAHRDELLSTAAAMELIHNSSLILDDMIDDSPLRRGRLSVQKQYGKPIALCSGVFQLVSALSWLLDRGYGESVRILMDAVQVTCDGEMIQHENHGNTEISEGIYLEAIRGKTAYVFQTACRLGCRITHRGESEERALGEFGLKTGIMFQLRDDLLDWTMEESELGKPVNEDFSEGVYTLPAICSFGKAGFGDRLRAIAKKSSLTREDLAEARRIVKESGGLDYASSYIRELGSQARAQLDLLPDDPCTEALRSVIDFLEMEEK